ncbi:alpha-L-fucosidase [Adhaeretor mobilis]|uniref:alpha-L-fucosidase n=1 Tax=Adhaeretor mobilis TaxID=1930276 RepID=A0A517N174_9BACT|nr:alpha-L-fucosidase [Adhaeretor mobilis]QDT00890.1 Alpha-L-fucosidase [Adhaeretor mobilis]
MKRAILPLLLIVLLTTAALPASAQKTESGDSPKQSSDHLEWWRDAKFGMFIHWGLYAVPAGVYEGKQIEGIGEWIMQRGKIPVAEYQGYAKGFNPVKYNPEAWAELAKNAGMKYIVITAKHHDGFALFPSDATEWDIADATPYKKDLITPLAEAARHRGLKFGTYYSQAQDWTHPGGAKAGSKEGGGWDDAHKGSFDEYLKKIAVPQTREILTRIKPDILWWDTPHLMTPERAKPLHDLIALRPGLITNNRLGGGYKGDTETPEQHIPATGIEGRDWETCMTMNDTWGYKSYDDNWKSTEVILRNLIDIVSKGGNYLLNVGPTAEGEIPEPSIQRLQQLGDWMKLNGSAIYGTTASPFAKLQWGRCTKKTTENGGTLYIHVFDWPSDQKLVIPGLRNEVTAARLLATGAELSTKATEGDVVVTVPQNAPDAIASVVELKFTGPLNVVPHLPGTLPDGSIVLDAVWADIHNTIRSHARLEEKGNSAKITDWNKVKSWLSWDFRAAKAGTYDVMAEIEGGGKSKLSLEFNKTKKPIEVLATDAKGVRSISLGEITIPKAGIYTLGLKPNKNDWEGFDLHRVTLTPTD